MPSTSRMADLALARHVAEAVGGRLREREDRRPLRQKADGSLLSVADLEADRMACELLAAAAPGDALISEESATTYTGSERVWVVDPLDGTTNYCMGVPVWGVTVALLESGRPVVGASCFPMLGLTFTAVAGGGAFLDGARLYSAQAIEAGSDELYAHCSRSPDRYELRLRGRRRVLGSAALGFALVAAGAFRVSISATARLWDLAAGWLMVEEAGGAVGVLDGPSPWPFASGDDAAAPFAVIAAASQRHYAAALENITRVDRSPA